MFFPLARRYGPLLLLVGFFQGCAPKILHIGAIPAQAECIAVVPFDIRFDLTAPSEMLSEFLAVDLERKGARGLLGPRESSALFEEARDPLPPVIDPFWAREVGRKLGVDVVLFGSISRMPILLPRDEDKQRTELHLGIDAFLVDVTSGEIRWAYASKEAIDAEDYVNTLNSSSEFMARTLLSSRKELPFGRRGCWRSPRVAARTPKRKQPSERPLTEKHIDMLARMKKTSGFALDKRIFIGRSANLTKEAIAILREIAFVLRSDQAPKRLRISSHVDATKNSTKDLQDSKSRAAAIKKYLVSAGVSPARLNAVGFGGSRPVVPNLNRRSREMNRRVILHRMEAEY